MRLDPGERRTGRLLPHRARHGSERVCQVRRQIGGCGNTDGSSWSSCANTRSTRFQRCPRFDRVLAQDAVVVSEEQAGQRIVIGDLPCLHPTALAPRAPRRDRTVDVRGSPVYCGGGGGACAWSSQHSRRAWPAVPETRSPRSACPARGASPSRTMTSRRSRRARASPAICSSPGTPTSSAWICPACGPWEGPCGYGSSGP